MSAQKTVVVVGTAGTMRILIATEMAKNNYRVIFASTAKEQYRQTLTYIQQQVPGAMIDFVDCEKDGCWEADLIVLAVPLTDIKQVAAKIKEVATQKTVICLSDDKSIGYFPFAEAQELQRMLPYSRVVTAFNSLHSHETLIAGDDREVVKEAVELVKAIGHLPVVAESLSAIRVL